MFTRYLSTRRAAVAAAVLASAFAMPWLAHATDTSSSQKPYTVKDGKVDINTYHGYLYYGDQCMRCHGPDGMGSSYAPKLVDSLKHMTKEQVESTIINGRKNVTTSNQNVMPAFGTNEDVVENIDNIYNYLLARSNGDLQRGHPEHLDP